MILNRLGLNNLIEPIAKDLEFQLQDPFLLYRNAKTKSRYYPRNPDFQLQDPFLLDMNAKTKRKY